MRNQLRISRGRSSLPRCRLRRRVAYGPLLDVWAAMTPMLDWSYFGFVKRMPVG